MTKADMTKAGMTKAGMTKVWVGAGLTDEDAATVSAFDHAVTVGDGCFETVKVVDGTPFALTRHLHRLARSAAGIGLPRLDVDAVRDAVAETLAANDRMPAARLRITVTGGRSPLGSERGNGPTTLIVALAPLHAWPPTCAVATVPWVRNERSAVAGLKTTSYAENVVALAHARRNGATEAIFANTIGNLCEGTGSNVFLVLDGRLVTPPLSSGCLAGVTRDLVLTWTGAEEVDVPLTALRDADEAFLASSTRDLQPVHAVDGTALSAAPGPLTRSAAETFAERSAADPDP